jgi:HlyD family secretion protein
MQESFYTSMTKSTYLTMLLFVTLAACKDKDNAYDATGNFEAVETIISAEGNGVLKDFTVNEGDPLKAGQTVGYIDTIQLHLQKKQLQASIQTILSRKPNIALELASLQEQLSYAQKERERIANLVKADAATQKNLDAAASQVEVLQRQVKASQNALHTSTKSIDNEAASLSVQIEQVNEQIRKAIITNPINGTVLVKYAELGEMAAVGKPLYSIADLSSIILRAYLTSSNYEKAKVGQTVKVRIDDGEKNYKEYNGTIEWISNHSEFTPKTIQTKDERANLVYAIKVKVKNDGYIKIGMYGQVLFDLSTSQK